jgi:septal ring-binding cell division protein DamX
MAVDRHESDSTRELRLEGIGLLLGGGLLLALLVGAFFLGRWVERRAGAGDVLAGEATGPLAQVAARADDAEAGEGLTYFDTVDGGEKQLESGREIPTPEETPAAATPRTPEAVERATQAAAREEGGRFYVQVLALRDQRAAAEVIESLERKGFEVRLFSEREGQGTLYKVRIGGYATRTAAESARDELRKAGHPGAFVWAAG